MNFFYTLNCDIKRYLQKDTITNRLKVILINHTFHLIFFYRLGVFCRKIPILGKIFGILIEYFIRIIYSSDISCKSKIGAGLMILHGHDIVIGADVVIGKNCKIFNGVTLGNKNTEININEQPILGNNVVVGTGAKILGKIFIGDNVKIGANSVVLIDIPSDSVAVGVPANIKRNSF